MSDSIKALLAPKLCELHGGISHLTVCAWPDCPNGTELSSVKAELLGTPIIKDYTRVKWENHDGDVIYDWCSEDLPSWFTLGNVFYYFLKKQSGLNGETATSVAFGARASNLNSQMFHYTNVDGALGILQSKAIRLTDYAFLNDNSEVTYGFDIFSQALKKIVETSKTPAIVSLNNALSGTAHLESYRIYTSSFSKVHDSLSQYRLYGPIALGFQANTMAFGYPKGDIHLDNVVYDLDEQTKAAELFLELLAQAHITDVARGFSQEKADPSVDTLIGRILSIAAFFKNKAFEDEREVRLLYSEPTELMGTFGLGTSLRSFRTSGGAIIPYTDTRQITNVPVEKLPLTAVWIGPCRNSDMVTAGVSDILRDLGYEDVPVGRIDAPLRS